jgi:hypothetical protein
VLAFCTFQALLYIPQTYLLNIRTNPSFTLARATVATLIPFYIYALLIPAVIWLGMRFLWNAASGSSTCCFIFRAA